MTFSCYYNDMISYLYWLFHGGGPYYIETRPLIGISVIKELEMLSIKSSGQMMLMIWRILSKGWISTKKIFYCKTVSSLATECSKLITEAYSKLSQTSAMELFLKIVDELKAVNCFHKNLQLRCLTGFWILFWIMI